MTKVLAVSAAREVMGTEHSLFNVTAHLPASGIEMMLAAEPGGALETTWRARGLPFFALAMPVRQGFRPNTGTGYHGLRELARLPIASVQSISRIRELVRRSDADVVHSNCLMTHLDCAIVSRLIRVGVVLELHDIVAPGIGRQIMGLAVWIAGTAIAVSSAVRDQLPRWARGRVVVIPQGVDVDRFFARDGADTSRSRIGHSADVPTVAAIGRIDPEKGLHVLVSAVGELRAAGHDVQLVLVGSPSKDDGSYLARLVELGERVLGDSLTIVPQVEDVPAVLASVDIVACPSTEEPFGLILLEAQACGVPVIATAAGGPLEFIVQGETGLLVAPGDTQEMADGLARLLGDHAFRHRIARAGQDRVRSSYTTAIRAEQFARLYRRVQGTEA